VRRLAGRLGAFALVWLVAGLVISAWRWSPAELAHAQSNRYPRPAGSLPAVATAGVYTLATGGTITIDAQGRVLAISPVTRTFATTSPLAGGGSLAADRTLSCPTCATTAGLILNRVTMASSSNVLKDDDSFAWSATGPSVIVKGLMKPYRIAGGSLAPTAAAGAGAQLGTGATCTVTGTDLSGSITLTTGTSPTAMTANSFNTLCTITFNTTYSGGPRVLVHPGNPAAAALSAGAAPVVAYVDPTTTLTTSFPVRIVSPGTPTLPASTALVFTYMVIQ